MPDVRWLVLMDTDSIKDYIFATNRLKEIRGASLLLEQLNQQECRDRLSKHNGEEIFIGGGGVLATFPTETDAKNYINAVQTAYREKTHIATITGVSVPVQPDAEPEALKHARFQLRLAKENPAGLPSPLGAGTGNGRPSLAGTHPLLTSPYFRLCESCNRYPVTTERDGDEICESCDAKRGEANKLFPEYSGYVRFRERIAAGNGHEPDARWLHFDELPAKLDRLEGPDTSHIGFIHADVNNLGVFLEEQDSLDDVKRVGCQIEATLESALVEAVQKLGLEPREATPNCWPFLIIILGGDDVTLIVPARRAVPLANELCLSFQEKIKQALGETTNARGQKVAKLALSAGVVISKPKHPAYALADLAEGLTKTAKRCSHELETEEKSGPVPTLDFQVIHTPTANPVEVVREDEYFVERGGQEYWYTSRPLPCDPVGAYPGVSTLLEIIRELRRSGFPRNKLNQWADLIYTTEVEQILSWQTLQTRVSGDAYQVLLKIIQEFDLTRERVFAQPGGTGEPYVTPLLDIIELYDFARIPEQPL